MVILLNSSIGIKLILLPLRYYKLTINRLILIKSHVSKKHLTKDQQKDLAELLGQFTKLFSGKLGKYEGKKVHLEVEKDARPKHAKPYSVPHTQMNLFKEELMRLVGIGVLRPIGATERASPTFILPHRQYCSLVVRF